MIGNFIKGMDLQGRECEGIIQDKVLVIQTVEAKGPGQLGRGQVVPIPLDAYLVVNETAGSIHLVPPGMISGISAPPVSLDEIITCIPDLDFADLNKLFFAIRKVHQERVNNIIPVVK